MVKIISNVKGDHVKASVELAGNMKAIVSELVNAIGSAYLQIAAQDKRAAQAFRKMFTQFVTSEDSPMWLEDSCDGVIVNASIVRAGKLTSEDVANAIRCGASKDVIKALLEEM
mgnify:FL=1|jgi:hypothetical protein